LDEETPSDASSCSGTSGTALIEERVQRRASALVRALAALVEGGLLGQAQPIAEELAKLLDPDAEVDAKSA
jgi:hypothetical protein